MLKIFFTASLFFSSFASANEVTGKKCQLNVETGKIFYLQAYPPEQRLAAYQKYVQDLQAGKYVTITCPPVGDEAYQLPNQ